MRIEESKMILSWNMAEAFMKYMSVSRCLHQQNITINHQECLYFSNSLVNIFEAETTDLEERHRPVSMAVDDFEGFCICIPYLW